MRATIRDVAEHAGVSAATVSYVINNKPGVSGAVRQVVENSIKELDYSPNKTARSLNTKNSYQFACLVNDISNPHYGSIITYLEKLALLNGYSILVCNGSNGIDRYIDDLVSRNVDGVTIQALPNKLNMEKLAKLHEYGMSVILSTNMSVDESVFSVLKHDYEDAMKQIIQHLLSNGHEIDKIAYLSLFDKPDIIDGRLSAYCNGMEKIWKQSPIYVVLPQECKIEDSIENGEILCDILMEKHKDVTAIITSTDLIAYGAISQMKKYGKFCPHHYSLVSFDNTYVDDLITPRLTSCGYSREEYSHKIFNMFLKMKSEKKTYSESVKFQLYQRDSVKNIRNEV